MESRNPGLPKKSENVWKTRSVFCKKKISDFYRWLFWHKCPKCYIEPKSNKSFWIDKIEKNIKRDKRNKEKLNRMGYTVIRIWEHEIYKNIDKCLNKILIKLKNIKSESNL